MIDAELRGMVLQDFYSRRNAIAPVHVSDILILLNGAVRLTKFDDPSGNFHASRYCLHIRI